MERPTPMAVKIANDSTVETACAAPRANPSPRKSSFLATTQRFQWLSRGRGWLSRDRADDLTYAGRADHFQSLRQPAGEPPRPPNRSARGARGEEGERGQEGGWELKMRGGQLCVATHNWVLAGRWSEEGRGFFSCDAGR
ncbi:MAG: hypothetical protein RL077_3100, partial [Verrucomicrobiota bacterium]